MCGIAGIICRDKPVQHEAIISMIDRIAYRGPDESGIWNKLNVALGHVRLSIIDLSFGKQPMEDVTKRFVIVYNGELYNYREIRDRLEKVGMLFQTNSDTEVVLNAYAKYGERSLEQFEGMYAYAIYDIEKQILFCARDRLGKKPLYYAFDNNQFVFASELSAIKASGLVPQNIDYQALGFYLALNYVPSPHSIIKGVKKLPHAHWLKFNLSKWTLEISKYWDTPERQITSKPTKDYVETTRQLLEEAVRKRLVSDVPVGVFLSGGLDSSGVVAYMSRFQDTPKSFSVSFSESGYDESIYARKVAECFKTEHTELKVNPKDTDNLQRILTSSGEPFGDPTLIPTYYMSHAAKKYVTVCLSGEGADEVFGGYRRFFQNCRGFALPWARKFLERIPVFRGKHRLFKRVLPQDAIYYESLFRYTFHNGLEHSLSHLLKPDVYRKVVAECDLYKFLSAYQNSKSYDIFSSRFYLDLNTYMVDNGLTKTDRGSMLASLEVRNPYLDHKLVEYVYTIPGKYLARFDNYKEFLKNVLSSILPDFVIKREKKGFDVPVSEWMRTHWKELVESTIFSDSIFNLSYLRNIWAKHLTGEWDYMYQIWLPFVFNLNMRKSEVNR